MTRLPPDSFLPSGAVPSLSGNEQSVSSFASHLHGRPTSVISPLSLPRAINHFPLFEESNLTGLPSQSRTHSPSAPEASRSPYRSKYIPDPIPPSVRDQRSTISPPTGHRAGPSVISPSVVPASSLGVVSPLGIMPTVQSTEDLLRRKESQNRRLIESWLAERAHLEANRARADEVYQEERSIMDDERMLWVEEKAKLEKDLSEWKSRAEAAEKLRDQMADLIKSLQTKSSIGTKFFDGSTEVSVGTIRGGGVGSPEKFIQSQPTVGPGGLPDRLSPMAALTNTRLGPTMPESKPFIPLDPRMQGTSPRVGSPKPQQELVPSIDIHEVIPELEGIRVRPQAVQKPTFTDEKPASPSAEPKKLSPPKQDLGRPRVVPAELTKEALQAPESDRLTMHAGHTPNHSMSLSRLHTVQSTAAANTATSSGAPTPTYHPSENGQGKTQEQSSQNQMTDAGNSLGIFKDLEARDGIGNARQDPEAAEADVLDDHDPELKGPLHLRNLPAADEPFLQSLTSKLEHVRANDIAPTVLEKQTAPSLPGVQQGPIEPKPTTQIEADEAHDAHGESAEGLDEEDIPLKLKKSNNFGQPLGQLGKSFGF
ncbi:hypothetical protein AAE478_008502 [Parahypoxylon ruwenzoriense]